MMVGLDGGVDAASGPRGGGGEARSGGGGVLVKFQALDFC